MLSSRTTLALLLLISVALLYVGSARAENREAWCAYYTDQSTNCGFSAFEQCKADISGNGGICSRNAASE